MRSPIVFLCSALLASVCFAQPQQSVQLSDLDRKADPCNDFFEYSNGAWRAQNPIPASMDRWSRRWQAGENNKEQLKSILDDAAKQNAAKGSTTQLTGDFYGACMDESKIDAAGIGPAEPLLKQIIDIQDGAGVQKMVASCRPYPSMRR